MPKPVVYFTKELSKEALIKLFDKLNINLKEKTAVKVHSGEVGNQNFLHPEFFVPIVEHVNGRVVECNTAYPGERNTTKKHKKTFEKHGWTQYFDVDLMDEDGSVQFDIPNGKQIKKNFVGKNLLNYNSMLVVSHFKGHPMGGFGGALKQLSIGCASTAGKAYIHSAGKTKSQKLVWLKLPAQDLFLESMADAASSVVEHFKGQIAFINVMVNLSVDCDCCAEAEDPCMKDIGILASLDPVAIDQACIDLVQKSPDVGRDHFMERVNSRHGLHTIETAEELGVGSREYELIEI